MATTKAFDLKLLVGRENIMGNKPKVAVESMETSDKNLYIGTNDGTLYHFLLLEDAPQKNRSSNNNLLSAFLQAQKRIATKKAIVQIKATTELKCLLINSDGGIFAYSMINLEPAFSIFGKMKNVSRFYINDHPVHANPFAVEMCVSYIKRKTVQIYQVQEDNVIPLKEISLPEHPLALALDGRHMCVGSNSGYMMVDLDTNSRQELLPPGENKLFVYKVAPAEFLLAAPNALGVFVTSAGISQRAPIQLSSSVSHACFVHPYVIAMDDEFLTVHSVVDQQQKQTLPFQGGTMLLQNAGKVLVCTSKDVFVLLPIPYDLQVSEMLAVGKVEQAMDLAKALRKSMPRDLYYDMMLMTYKKAGFVHFQQMEFDLAEDMFNKGRLDIREVISLYDGILPSDSNFVRSVNPYHSIASVQQLCGNDAERLSKYDEFLSSYLQMHPLPVSKGNASENPFDAAPSDTQPGFRSDIFLSAITIFAKLHRTEQILALLQEKIPDTHTEPVGAPFFYEFKDAADDISRILKNANCDHASSIHFMLCGNIDAAMLIWKDLSTGKKIDIDFPGLRFVAKCLGRFCKDMSILWKHAEWMLELNQSIGVSVFTDHLPVLDESPGHRQETENQNWPKPDDVISFLNRYAQALIMYLEYLVFVCRIPKEKHHTHLAVLYLERVLKLKEQKNQNESELDAARSKLQKLLKESSTYRISLILGKVKEAGMHPECVILYGKLSEHKKALGILVEEMSDQKAAEEYCMAQGVNNEEKKQLFEHLLEIYLSGMVTHEKRTKSAMATVDLLNRYAEYYDVQRVLGSLPESWSTTLLSQFLSHSVRLKMHRLQTSYVQLMLERSENNNARKEQMGVHNTNVRLTEDKICEACNKLFRDTDCAFYPNRVPVHVQCGNNIHVCPVTGRLFKALPAPKYS